MGTERSEIDCDEGAARRATAKPSQKFLHTHKLWRPQTAPERLEIFARAASFTGGSAATAAKSLLAVSLAKMLLTVEAQLEIYRERIEKLFGDPPQSGLFGSLPGAGSKLAPRLQSLVPHRVEEGVEAAALQSLAGTAPVTIKSGQITKKRIRRQCDKMLRCVVHQWADCSRRKCVWAETYYQNHRKKGQSHACALRCLGQRWLKILAKMCRTGESYDEAHHTRNQVNHGSWILTLNPAA